MNASRRSARRTPALAGRVLSRVVSVLALCACMLGWSGPDRATQVGEYALKAAYLEKFHKYVEWPDEAFADETAPFVIAIFGKDPFGEELEDVLAGKKHGTHPIRLVRTRDLKELAGAHVVFVTAKNKDRIGDVAAAAVGRHQLIVSESTGLALKGAIINFYLESKKVRFEVNPKAGKRAGLTISSALLKLARIVDEEEERR